MDRLVYVAMSGAKETLRAQTTNSYNLANVSSAGFRADLSAFQSQQVQGAGLASRAYATNNTVGADMGAGTIEQTGRNLDVAVQGPGWIAVQSPEGSEAYTRAGDLRVDPNGQLTTAAGYPVLSDSGPIAVPGRAAAPRQRSDRPRGPAGASRARSPSRSRAAERALQETETVRLQLR